MLYYCKEVGAAMSIDDIINSVISGVKEEWPLIYKIRYVYITLGKFLKKNTDFFFSVDHKLGEMNMSFQDIRDAYSNDDELSESIICKSSSIILKMIYDRLGIKSRLVKSLNNIIEYDDGTNKIDINHWFLAVSDGENEYFCTLSSDLPYIQMGMETRHFGVNIPYFKKIGDIEQQVYEGEEIKHTVISKELLRKIDIAIGYIKNQYHYDENYSKSSKWSYNYDDAALSMLSEAMNSNKMYNDLEIRSTDFYSKLMNFEGADGRSIDLSDIDTKLSKEDWNIWLKNLCNLVLERVNLVTYYKINSYPAFESDKWNYQEWLTNVCKQLQRYFIEYVDVYDSSLYVEEPFNFQRWSRLLKKKLSDDMKMENYDNLLTILDEMNALASFVIKGEFNKHFSSLLHSLAYHFVHEKNLYEKSLVNGKVSSKYIAHKFKKLFNVIFDCGNTRSEFNDMSYSEQIVIIKMILERMFKELNKSNSFIEGYDDNYSPVFNRINLYSIKNKKTGEYSIVFHILDDGTFADTYYFYDPKENEFKLADIIDIYSNFIIVSNRFKSKIEEMENIEVEEEKKVKV